MSQATLYNYFKNSDAELSILICEDSKEAQELQNIL